MWTGVAPEHIPQYDHSMITSYGTQIVQTAALVRALAHSVDYSGNDADWFAPTFVDKILDHGFSKAIDWVLNDGLKCPLNVIFKNGEWTMGNGHHRLFAAILCGIEEIEIDVTSYCSWDNSEMHDVGPLSECDCCYYQDDDSFCDITNCDCLSYSDEMIEIAADILSI